MKMARIGRKYAALFELSALAGSETPHEDWASRLLRLMSSAAWADPSFLEELSESGLVRAMCRALPLLKANAANRANASSVQDLADLEESMRKLRHELALAEKRLPSHGVLGSGGSAFYTTWDSVGHVCTLMLQALTYGAASGQSPAVASNARASLAPADASRAANVPPSPAPAGSDAAATPQAAGVGAQAGDAASPAATPAPATDGAGAAVTPAGGPSGASTPRGGAPLKAPGGGAVGSPGNGGGMPALATEGGLIKLLGNKHVVAHAKQVMGVVPVPYKAALARILLTQISTEMKATQAGLVHILQILQGDPAATTPAPSSLPKAWFTTAALLTVYSDALRTGLSLADGGSAVAEPEAAGPASAEPPVTSEGSGAGLANGGPAAGDVSALPSSAAPPDTARAAPSGADSDVEMADAPPSAALAAANGADATGPTEERPAGTPAESEPDFDAAGATGGASAPSTPPARKGAAGAKSDSAVASPLGARPADSSAAGADDDPRVALAQLLRGVASALCEAVTGAHGVGRMALLLRGEAAVKFPNAGSYMPAALSINELMGHLDGLACVATALSASDAIRPSVTALLTSPAMKELLGAGKVYVTTVIAAGALTRDLAIDAVIPQSLRQGYMAAVLTPLETGALLNERRAPQVLAYRNSITESSYYQVMDAEALPYGVNVRFEDEQEAEGMGVVREWLSQIAADIFSPERGLFVRGAADKRVIHPASHSRLQEDYLGYMRFAGRIVGLALRANVPLGMVLSTGLFNYLTGRRATLQDLQQLDPQVYITCQNILSTPEAEALELYHVWHASSSDGSNGDTGGADGGANGSGASNSNKTKNNNCGCSAQEQELLPGGASLRVTDANKAEYVALLANHVVVTVVEEQCAAFLAGVQDTAHHLPDDARLRRSFLSPLLLEDLNRITAGESSLDPDDWADHTDVAGFDGPEEQSSLDMFWQLVSEYSLEDRQRLLQFWTAMTHLPSGGFKALNQRLQIMKFGPLLTARPVGGAPAADGPGAEAASPNANGHGPSTDGAGPHSHRIDGDSLEVEEPEEQSDGMEELAEDEPEPQRQQQQQGTPAEGGSGEGVRGSRVGDAAPAAEADLAGASGAGVGLSGAAAAGAAPASPGTGGAAAAQAPADGDEGGDDADVPYGEEDEEAGAGEEGMDYGDEDDEEEFQRQLEMALALSLQDMSAEEPPPQGDGAGAGAGAGGAEEGAGRAAGAEGGAAGGSGQGSSEPPAGAPSGTAAAPSASGEQAGPGDGAPGSGQAGGSAGSAAARTETAGDAAGAAGASAAAAGGSANGSEPESAAASHSGFEPQPAEDTPPSAQAFGARGGDGSSAAAGSAATAPEACSAAAGDSVRPEGAAAAAPSGTGPSQAAGGAAAAGGSEQQGGEGGSSAAIPHAPGESGAAASVDADVGQGVAPGQTADRAAPGGSGAGSSGEDTGSATPAATPSDAQTAAAPGSPQWQGGAGQQLEPQGQGQQQAQERQQEQQQEQQQAGGEQQQQQQGQGAQQSAAALAAGVAGDAPGGNAGAGAPLAPSTSVSRALPLLPQARTCFLQLNLPVYGSIEDMRRAFAIALDNMSFGLH